MIYVINIVLAYLQVSLWDLTEHPSDITRVVSFFDCMFVDTKNNTTDVPLLYVLIESKCL